MKRKHIILIHILFWLYIVYQSIFPLFFDTTAKSFSLLEFLYSMLFILINFYLFYLFLPFIFRQNIKFLGFLYGLIFACAVGIVRTYTFLYSYKSFFPSEYANEIAAMKDADLQILIYHFRGAIVTSIYALLIYIVIEWLKSQKLRAELVTQNKTSEMALLKSQINPHFLFNTLNNIDSLVHRYPDKASASVIKLSEIMRYMIYDTSADFVPLCKEIEYLDSFIELQRLRLKDPDYVSFTITGFCENKTIAPMLFIPFIENAFKHGSKQRTSPGVIFSLQISDNQLRFKSLNYYNSSQSQIKDKTSGIGLVNVKRRLELIYPGKYILLINDKEDQFEVDLTLSI